MPSPQATALNQQIQSTHPKIFKLFSKRGQRIFFPEKGIMSQSADAKGKKFNATIGIATEDDDSPMRLPSVANQIKLDPKDAFPYAPSFGKPELRQKWQEMIRAKNPSLENPISLPIATCALTHALTLMGYLFLDPEDQLLVTDKFWGNYKLTFDIGFDAQITTFNTFDHQGLNISTLKEQLSKQTDKTVLLLNFPNNPAGYTPTNHEAEQIINILHDHATQGHPTLVILDDSYFGLVYEKGILKESLFSKLANTHENLLAAKIDGATKEDYVWGFRVGFITYGAKGMTNYKALENKTAGAVRGTVSNIPHISQSILLKTYSSPNYKIEKQHKFDLLKNRYLKVREILNNPDYQKYFTPLPFNSGYFMCLELKHNLSAETIRQKLLAEYDTGVIALGTKLLRIAYSSIPETALPQLFANIYGACQKDYKLIIKNYG